MKFTKMHGAGNDFIIVDNRSESIPQEKYREIAKILCKRKTGIGADGMMFVEKPHAGGDFAMAFFNDDGTKGEMCGNGARCIARYGRENGLFSHEGKIETTAGIVTAWHISGDNYKIRLNDPTVIKRDYPLEIDKQKLYCDYIELGNPGIPHAVLLVDSLDDRKKLFDLATKVRHYHEFPKGANVNFVLLKNENEFDILTFERGVENFTLACGTGSGASAVALATKKLVAWENILINNPGGLLTVTLKKRDNNISDIYLSGPTCLVANGETDLIKI